MSENLMFSNKKRNCATVTNSTFGGKRSFICQDVVLAVHQNQRFVQ